MRYMQAIVIAAVIIFVICASALALKTEEKAPAFKLNDQFAKTWDIAKLKGQVVVIVAADRDSGRLMDPWVGGLKDKYAAKIQLLGLLDLHTVPWIGRGIAKSRIRRETKDPLMLDFDGATGKAYEVSSKCPVIVVIDKLGIVKATASTVYSENAFKGITAAIDEVMK